MELQSPSRQGVLLGVRAYTCGTMAHAAQWHMQHNSTCGTIAPFVVLTVAGE